MNRSHMIQEDVFPSWLKATIVTFETLVGFDWIFGCTFLAVPLQGALSSKCFMAFITFWLPSTIIGQMSEIVVFLDKLFSAVPTLETLSFCVPPPMATVRGNTHLELLPSF